MSDASRASSAADDRRKLVRNEPIKATANLLNSIANTTIAAGAVGAIAADLYGVAVPKTPYWVWFAGCWTGIGVLIHLISRTILGGLKP